MYKPAASNSNKKSIVAPPILSEQLNSALAHCLVDATCFRVQGQQTGYRSKICYTLVINDENHRNKEDDSSAVTHVFTTSTQAKPVLNAICTIINDICQDFCSSVKKEDFARWKEFFVEVTGKITRKDEIMIKLAVTHDLTEEFIDKYSKPFVDKINTEFQKQQHRDQQQLKLLWGELKCFILHIAPPGQRKATKFSEDNDDDDGNNNNNSNSTNENGKYVPIFENRKFLFDLTPNGVPVRVCADSFTEINYEMEDEMHRTTVEFILGSSKNNPINNNPVQHDDCGLFMGRDCNVQYLSMKHVYGDRVLLTTGCPRAFRDAAAMDLPNFACVPKDKISDSVFDHAFLHADERYNKNENSAPRKKWDFIITAGRHGIVPTASEALIAHHVVSRVRNFIYTSCNVDSLTRDLHVFRRAYYIQNVRSFDFFPGTRYTMTMVHLLPRYEFSSPVEKDDSIDIIRNKICWSRNLLVLPIGLPACGKSSCSRVFKDKILSEPPAAVRIASVFREQENNRKRFLNRRREVLECLVFERDEIFKQERSVEGRSLNSTKIEVHNKLVQFLGLNNTTDENEKRDDFGGIYILDSSNGQIEQRSEYSKMWRGGVSNNNEQRKYQQPVLEIFFKLTNPEEQMKILLERCLARKDHPAFPSENEEEAKKKIEAISKAIQKPDLNSSSVAVIDDCCQAGKDWNNTFSQFAWMCWLGYFTNFDLVGKKILETERRSL